MLKFNHESNNKYEDHSVSIVEHTDIEKRKVTYKKIHNITRVNESINTGSYTDPRK